MVGFILFHLLIYVIIFKQNQNGLIQIQIYPNFYPIGMKRTFYRFIHFFYMNIGASKNVEN